MPEPFDFSQYAAYLRQRWKFFALACGSAVCIALLGSLLLPKKYTATVSIVIEPGSSRSANVVSPVYLESLKMYETFASSDVAFERALDQFHLRGPESPPVETLKKAILQVTKVRDTRILLISATLADPRKALEFAQYIAGETVRLNQSVTGEVSRDSFAAAERESSAARETLDRAEADWARFPESGSIDALQEELASLADLKERTQRDLMAANVEVAGLKPFSAPGSREISAAEAKAAFLAKQASSVDQEFAQKNSYLSRLMSRRDLLQSRVESARKIYENTEVRLREQRSAAGLDGDRLMIIDSGTVPSRPSSPKIVRNTEAALLLAFIASLIFLSISFTSARRGREAAERYRLHA